MMLETAAIMRCNRCAAACACACVCACACACVCVCMCVMLKTAAIMHVSLVRYDNVHVCMHACTYV